MLVQGRKTMTVNCSTKEIGQTASDKVRTTMVMTPTLKEKWKKECTFIFLFAVFFFYRAKNP